MKFSTLSKAGFAASVCAALAGGAAGVQAGTLQDTIFGKVEPSIHDRMFVRLHYVSANIKTTTKDAYDVTGPVLGVNDYADILKKIPRSVADDADSSAGPSGTNYDNLIVQSVLEDAVSKYFSYCPSAPATGLGTPCGIRAKGQNRVGTVAMSVGYFLTEDRSWALEALLLGKPVSAAVYGDGRNGLNGKKIVSTKLLPPILSAGYYFGGAASQIRPYLGVAASYAIFFDTKAENDLNVYQGGGGADSTTVSIKNSVGLGGFVGFKLEPKDSPWHASLSIGKIRFKTEATLVTKDTVITSSTPVLRDYGPVASSMILAGDKVYSPNLTVNADNVPVGYVAGQSISLVNAMMCDLARAKSGINDCNLGTFVRKTETILDNTMFMFSVGHTF